ncbi:MAG TPA: hypothetical protein VEL73_07145, partial [Mycobacteriales bacterium]|nr:hypothetical protein [Mycobacteriales bacterium]
MSSSTRTASRDGTGPLAPFGRPYDPDVLETARRWWWLPLVAGVLWTLWGAAVLTLRPVTILSVAILAGISFILGGIS